MVGSVVLPGSGPPAGGGVWVFRGVASEGQATRGRRDGLRPLTHQPANGYRHAEVLLVAGVFDEVGDLRFPRGNPVSRVRVRRGRLAGPAEDRRQELGADVGGQGQGQGSETSRI